MSYQGFAYINFIIIAVILILFTGGVLVFTDNTIETISCTADAKVCPDGSYVSRVAPSCEFAACPEPSEENGQEYSNGDDWKDLEDMGVIEGKITIGPLCPVEPCSGPIPDPYSSRKVVLEPLGASGVVDIPDMIPIRSDGTYTGALPEGNYSVTISECDFLGCRFDFPKTVRVRGGETTTLDIDIDTGIR